MIVWHTVVGKEGSDTPAAASTESPAPQAPAPASVVPLLVPLEVVEELEEVPEVLAVPVLPELPEVPGPLLLAEPVLPAELLPLPVTLPEEVCVPPEEPVPPDVPEPVLVDPDELPLLESPSELPPELPHAGTIHTRGMLATSRARHVRRLSKVTSMKRREPARTNHKCRQTEGT
jgi:hypothetical protein